MLKRLRLIAMACLTVANPMWTAAQNRQNTPTDTLNVRTFNGIAVHADAIGAIQMATADHGQWEAGLRINIKDKFFPAAEIGLGKADQQDEYKDELRYSTKAPYFRIGCDYNILRNKHDPYKAFVGLRYAFSKFNYDITVEQVTTTADDPATEADETATTTTYQQYEDLKATYHWLEAIFGVDAKIWGPLHLGWDIRYRRLLTSNYENNAEPWYTPGFGNKKKAGFAATFNVTLSF